LKDNKKSKGLPFFNYNKDGKGVKKEESNLPYTFINFFKYFPRHFSKMLSLNIAMVLGNFPIFFLLPVFAQFFNIDSIAPLDIRYPVIGGFMPFVEEQASLAPLIGSIAGFGQVSIWSPVNYVFIGLAFLAIFTFGPVNASTSYIVRNLLKGEPVFMWDDMKYSIKRNAKQSIIYGIFDLFLCFMLAYDIIFFFFRMNVDFMHSMFFYVSIVSFVFYMFMRYYIYMMMVTFDLKLRKIFKNAMIFAFLGFKRNILAFLGIALVVIMNLLIFSFGPLMALGIALPFVVTMGICTYIAAYASWPKIKEIMIDPYYKDEEPEEDNNIVIMKDVL